MRKNLIVYIIALIMVIAIKYIVPNHNIGIVLTAIIVLASASLIDYKKMRWLQVGTIIVILILAAAIYFDAPMLSASIGENARYILLVPIIPQLIKDVMGNKAKENE